MLTVKGTGKRNIGRPRSRWKDNVRMNLKVIGFNAKMWIASAQVMDYRRALVNEALNLRIE